MALFAELKRRKVFKVGAAYLVVAWVVVQAASIGFPAFDLPPRVLRLCILVAALGFPLALVLSWVIDVTPEGLRFDPATRGNKRLASVAVLMVVLVLGWYFQGQPAFHPNTPTSAPVAPDAHSIAVLPFVNMSTDKEQDYFSDGLSEELLNMLGQVPQLRVIARTSSFSFKGKAVDVATIARALNVASVLEGSVRKSGTTLRITAQLVRASDSTELWSAIYDRELTDVFKVQDDIAGAVVTALKVRLLPAQHVTNPHRTRDSRAYTQYLLGNQFFNRATADGYRRATVAYRQAIALDPEYAAAYAGLAVAEVFSADSAESTAENAAAKERGLTAADKAIALAPGLADGYTARGWMRSNFTWDWAGAQSDLETALAIDPSNSTVQRRYGQLLGSRGRLPEAIAAVRKSVALDPLSAPPWSNLGYYLLAAGEMDEARQALQHALSINPESTYAQVNLATLELRQGHTAKALDMFRQSDDTFRPYGIALAEHSLGHPRESQQALDSLIAGYAQDSAAQVAEVYAWRGETDKAFQWLDRAYAQHDGGLSDLLINPMLVSLRADPRFQALARKLGLATR
ncbi:MAG: protein kinase [Xanthomonadaceae bacterium]|nr:protein kinase [Xanthomonadaceae bacterium]